MKKDESVLVDLSSTNYLTIYLPLHYFWGWAPNQIGDTKMQAYE